MQPRGSTCITCCQTPHAQWCYKLGRSQTPQRRQYHAQHGYAHQVLRAQMLRENPMCALAHTTQCHGPLQLDYIIPLSLGGQPTRQNAQVLCQRHNIAKGGRNRIKK